MTTTRTRPQAIITIDVDPEGYSKGCYGYRLDIGGDTWRDGGYPSQDQAEGAARQHVGRLKRDGMIPATTIIIDAD